MAQSLEPVSDSVSPSLCPSPAHALSVSLSKINIKKLTKNFLFKKIFLMFIFDTERDRARVGEGQREEDTESETGSRL